MNKRAFMSLYVPDSNPAYISLADESTWLHSDLSVP